MRLIRDGDLPAGRPLSPLARELDSVVDDADAGQHGDVWSSLVRRFRVEKGKLAGQGFHGQVRIAKCAVGGAG